jgi:hypothetical protein
MIPFLWFWLGTCTFLSPKQEIKEIHVEMHQIPAQISTFSTPQTFHLLAPGKLCHPTTGNQDSRGTKTLWVNSQNFEFYLPKKS